MTTEAAAVLSVLRNADAPVRSKRIAAVTGVPWRQVIDAVRELRLAGYWIANLPGGGYKLAQTREERAYTRASLVAKGSKIFEVVAALDAADPTVAQMTLDV